MSLDGGKKASVGAFWVLEASKLILSLLELAFPVAMTLKHCTAQACSPSSPWSFCTWSLTAPQERCKVLGVCVKRVPAVSCLLLQVLKASLWVFT